MSGPARRAAAVALGTVALAVLPAGSAAAHPLGNVTENSADRLVVTAEGVSVTHVLDLAEIPTVVLKQASRGVDTDRDGRLSDDELSAYGARECARVQPLLGLVVDGQAAPLVLTASSGRARPGTGSLLTTRVECTLVSDVRPDRDVRFSDDAAGRRNGWREVSADSRCGALRASDVPADSPSALLTAYPVELLQSPPDVTAATFSVDRGAACTGGDTGVAAPGQVAPRGLDRLSRVFTDLVNPDRLSLPFALLALVASVGFGALHAVAPGHGKTVMAAYLVGQRGSRRQALQLGAFVTFSHTASVLALGAALSLVSFVQPELVVPATEVLSGVLLAAVGVYLLVLGARRLRGTPDHQHGHEHRDHEHGHDDHGDHPHGDHDEHEHGHGDHDHPHPPARELVGAGAPTRAAPPAPVHSHGGRAHSHAPVPEGRLSLRTLAAVGVAGGLVPSPSALLVLLGATALGRAWFGVLLVLAYGVGMAATLTAAGLLLLRARAAVDRRGWTGGRAARLVRLIPVLTAGLVLLLGLVLVVRGVGTGRPLL